MILGSFQVSAASSYTGKYWLKVNEQCNVVTAYKKIDGKWKPVEPCSAPSVQADYAKWHILYKGQVELGRTDQRRLRTVLHPHHRRYPVPFRLLYEKIRQVVPGNQTV